MITKINKIKKLGIFNDYNAKPNLRDFKKYNLIYGWNGCGKTTFSRVFDSLESGVHNQFPEIEYEIADESGNKFKQGQPFTQKIRVFNQDYVERNLKILEGKAKSITLVLGTVGKEVAEQIEKDEIDLKLKFEKVKKETEKSEQKKTANGKTFTEIAKTIYVAITGGAIRTYRKDNAEEDFARLTNKQLLSEGEPERLIAVIKQIQKPRIDPLKAIEVEFVEDKKRVSLETALSELMSESRALLGQTVTSVVIDRFKDHLDISDWVEAGLRIHRFHGSKSCEFCGQEFSGDRLNDLAKHFNDADKKLKEKIDKLVGKFSEVKEALTLARNFPDVARLYEEIGVGYEAMRLEFSREVSAVHLEIAAIQESLKEKKSRTTERIDFSMTVNIVGLNNFYTDLRGFIDFHNKKTADFESEKKEAIRKLKNHYLSTIFDDVKLLEGEIALHKAEIKKLNEGDPALPTELGIIALKERIVVNRARISSTHKACEDINKGMATFLGRNELVFEPHKIKALNENGVEEEIEDGYIIKRNDKVVTHLSEGEKTAIAFVYFTIHLNEPSFNKATGIIVVDDPISSLDSNSLFQAFSFLKNSVKDAGQVFIMTHNFDFLRLVLNWLQNKRAIPVNDRSFFMINNQDGPMGRTAFLDELDKDLQDHETEYNYLFKILKTFQLTGGSTIASVYHMPNIARKVLEGFLMFRVPNSMNTYDKLESLKPLFDENKITAIYKFTNDQSHVSGRGFDPSLIPETQKAVKYLLQFIEAAFPEHYKILMNTA